MTRFADVTGLDTLGVPVWQAIRPWGRSISVHQGKGLDPALAQIGAAMEAIECAAAESWRPDDLLRCSFDALPEKECAGQVDDFARRRCSLTADQMMRWALADTLGPRPSFRVPVSAVSLDLSVAADAPVERSSNGQGAGFDLGRASLKGLCELIERDAFRAWLDRPVLERTFDAIDTATIDYPWFRQLMARWSEQRVVIRLFRLPAVIDMPSVAAELLQIGEVSRARKSAVGMCSHPDPELALQGAVLEAAQARLGEIAGSRDDIDPGRPTDDAARMNFALPLPPGASGHEFHALWKESAEPDSEGRLRRAVEQLAAAGYDRVGQVVLTPADATVQVVKVFAPGLGALDRARRDPLF